MLYGFKEVPDAFFCLKGSKTVDFALTTLKYFKYENDGGVYYLTFKDVLFDPTTFLLIEEWLDRTDLYLRSYKRNKETGKDEPFCMKFEGLKFISSSFDAAADGDPAEFFYTIAAESKSFIEDSECPYRTIDGYKFD